MKLIKKISVAINVFGSIFLVLLLVLGTRMCFANQSCNRLSEALLHDWLIFTFVFPLMLVFSLITFRMKDEIFKSWIKFTAWYVPVLIIAVLILPMNISGGLGIGDFYREGLNRFALALLFLAYVVVSTIKIVKARRASK